MRKESFTTEVKKIIDLVCDCCGNTMVAMGHRIKQCRFCHRDVCHQCAYYQDLDLNLTIENNYYCDYPDYICKECWEKTEPLRKEIQAKRDENENQEEKLFEKIYELCQAVPYLAFKKEIVK